MNLSLAHLILSNISFKLKTPLKGKINIDFSYLLAITIFPNTRLNNIHCQTIRIGLIEE